MPIYRYEWELILSGHGVNPQEAWENALESFVQDPGDPGPPIEREMVDPDPDIATDKTEVVTPPHHQLWLVWSIEHNAWWGPGGRGYFKLRQDAGRYEFSEAVKIVSDANLYRFGKAPNEAMVLADD